MTLAQKIDFVVMVVLDGYGNVNAGIPSLCIPPLLLTDGPNGVAYQIGPYVHFATEHPNRLAARVMLPAGPEASVRRKRRGAQPAEPAAASPIRLLAARMASLGSGAGICRSRWTPSTPVQAAPAP